jgi:membrane-associated phospholipid phosphatase
MQKLLSICCWLFISTLPSFSQDTATDQHTTVNTIPSYFKELKQNFKSTFVQPLGHQKIPIKNVLLFASIKGGLLFADRKIQHYAATFYNSRESIKNKTKVITEFGGKYGLAVVGTLGITSLLIKDKKLLHTSLMASQAFVTSGIAAQLIKRVVSRTRPNMHNRWTGPFHIFHPTDAKDFNIAGSDFHSFPSGHTTTAFSLATVYAMQYKNKKAIPIIAYTMASIVGATRVIKNSHWASDVFAGSILGYLCGRTVVRNHTKLLQQKNTTIAKIKNHVSLLPQQNVLGQKGVGLFYSF